MAMPAVTTPPTTVAVVAIVALGFLAITSGQRSVWPLREGLRGEGRCGRMVCVASTARLTTDFLDDTRFYSSQIDESLWIYDPCVKNNERRLHYEGVGGE